VAVLPSGNPLHDAIVLGRTAEALALLASTSTGAADLQRRFPQGWTLLHLAAYHGDASLVLALLARGLRPDVRDDLGNTPLHTAARFDRVGPLVLLAMKGAPLDAANAAGKTPLRLAIENDCHLAVRALVRLGARQPTAEPLRPAAILLRSRHGVTPVPDPRPERLWQRWQDDFRLFGSDRDRIRRVLSNPRLDAETQVTIIQAILRQRGIDPDRP
jgi:ankyrin repeat protein